MILLAQATLSGQRRRRGGLASFRRHPLFAEALTVFELSVEATGEHRAELEAWRSGGAPMPRLRAARHPMAAVAVDGVGGGAHAPVLPPEQGEPARGLTPHVNVLKLRCSPIPRHLERFRC